MSDGSPPNTDAIFSGFDPLEIEGAMLALRLKLFRMRGMQELENSEHKYLLHYMPDELRTRVAGVYWSEIQKFPTFLINSPTDKIELMQVRLDPSTGKFTGIRVMPDADESVVWAAMGFFLNRGESIDPAHVKFGETQHFKDRMVPIWTEAHTRWKETGQIMPHSISPFFAGNRPTASSKQFGYQ